MKYICFWMLSLVVWGIRAQTTVISTTAEVKEATVFTSGAEVSNMARVNLPKGNIKLVIQNVARDIDVKSVQLAGPDGLTVLSIMPESMADVDITHPVHRRLKDSLDAAQARRELLANRQVAAQGALKILNNDQLLSGGGGKVDLGDLSKLVDYYQVKAVELHVLITKLGKDITTEDKIITRLREQIRAYAGDGGQLAIQLVSAKPIQGELTFSYMTYSASWQAYYDLRAKSISSPLQILYKARVIQNSGVDWKNVKLLLSTGNPSQSGTAPLLSPSYAVVVHPQEIAITAHGVNQRNVLQNRIQSIGTRAPMLEEVVTDAPDKELETPQATMNENQLSATFDIEVPYDIVSNGQPHSVTLKEYDHPALFKYYAVPKLDKDAFLLAEIRDFEKFNLVPGEANIIFENMFVGQSYINPAITMDTLNLSMGRDKAISIKRERVLDAKSTQVSGSSKRQTYTYELRVRNNKSSTINMLLKDQYPISTDKSIEIELVNDGGAAVNKETGILTWTLSVRPGETQTYRFTFNVKHPKDKNVVIN